MPKNNLADIQWNPEGGNGAITVYSENLEGCQSEYVTFSVSIIPSYIAKNGLINIHLYPNPVNKNLNIALPEIKAKVIISVCDISGKSLWINEQKNTNNIVLDMENYMPGIYFINLETEDFRRTYKIIKAENRTP